MVRAAILALFHLLRAILPREGIRGPVFRCLSRESADVFVWFTKDIVDGNAAKPSGRTCRNS
jgi:hypothetical protein